MAESLSSSSSAVNDAQLWNTEKIAETLSAGFIGAIDRGVIHVQKLLDELIWRQEDLHSRLKSQNEKYSENETIKRVHLTMLHTHQYYKKLLQIKKDMLEIHSKASKLKSRVAKLKDNEEKKLTMRQKILQIQENKEKRLIAKTTSEDNPQAQ